jgi:diacylglycerol kinase (ATP)
MTAYALIANPSSGRGVAVAKAKALREALGDEPVEILESTRRGSARELSAEISRRVDVVIAVGGDGTLNEVLNGVIESGLAAADRPALGFLSAGTANVATRAFRLTTDPVAMARSLAGAASRPIDVGMVRHSGGERAFLLWFGAGWDAVVIRTLNAHRTGLMGLSGLAGAFPGIIKDLLRYDEPSIAGTVDGVPFGEYGSVIVANVGEIALGGAVTDRADPGDGWLDVVAVPPTTLLRFVRHAARMMASTLTSSHDVRHAAARHVALRAEGEVPFQLDGEPIGTLPAGITVLPGAVRLLATS